MPTYLLDLPHQLLNTPLKYENQCRICALSLVFFKPIIPPFHYSNCERSELTCLTCHGQAKPLLESELDVYSFDKVQYFLLCLYKFNDNLLPSPLSTFERSSFSIEKDPALYLNSSIHNCLRSRRVYFWASHLRWYARKCRHLTKCHRQCSSGANLTDHRRYPPTGKPY